jgi:uncharacterized membrane protein YbhN (UPF0104 family)
LKTSWYKYLIYASLIFLAIALYRADYLKPPNVFHHSALVISFLFLFAGFVGTAVAWQKVLQSADFYMGWSECMAGVGLSIFGKYIPGKLWVVIGRAAYASEMRPGTFGRLSALSLNAQVISIWIGLVLGAPGLFVAGQPNLFGWIVLTLLSLIALFLFSPLAHRTSQRLLRVLLRKDMQIPILSARQVVPVLPWYTGTWMVWATGFYFMTQGLLPEATPWSVSLGFPLATTVGMVSIVTPGGLGAREGVMAAYLTAAGLPLQDAISISVAARLWFLIGEIFIFALGWVAHHKLRKERDSTMGDEKTSRPSITDG